MLRIEHSVELKNKTTIRLGGCAPYYAAIRSKEDLLDFAEQEPNMNLPFRILGGGSNLIIADASIHKELPFGILDIDISGIEEIQPFNPSEAEFLPPLVQKKLQEGHKNFAKVTVGAGYKIPKLLQLCKTNGFTGLEGLAGIPCRTGGTVAMNAGAFGTEINDVLYETEIFSKKTGLRKFSRNAMRGEYRKMHFQCGEKETEDGIILSASFIFPAVNAEEVQNKIRENYFRKKNTQPLQAFTAGCVFKNPENENGGKISAGLLLDKAGMKNTQVNAMRFSPVHASFLENTGNGTAKDALELLALAKDKVLTLFNIHLEEEVKIWI